MAWVVTVVMETQSSRPKLNFLWIFVFEFQARVRRTDGQTDGRTERRTEYNV